MASWLREPTGAYPDTRTPPAMPRRPTNRQTRPPIVQDAQGRQEPGISRGPGTEQPQGHPEQAQASHKSHLTYGTGPQLGRG